MEIIFLGLNACDIYDYYFTSVFWAVLCVVRSSFLLHICERACSSPFVRARLGVDGLLFWLPLRPARTIGGEK